jgi:hypothetical protein
MGISLLEPLRADTAATCGRAASFDEPCSPRKGTDGTRSPIVAETWTAAGCPTG